MGYLPFSSASVASGLIGTNNTTKHQTQHHQPTTPAHPPTRSTNPFLSRFHPHRVQIIEPKGFASFITITLLLFLDSSEKGKRPRCQLQTPLQPPPIPPPTKASSLLGPVSPPTTHWTLLHGGPLVSSDLLSLWPIRSLVLPLPLPLLQRWCFSLTGPCAAHFPQPLTRDEEAAGADLSRCRPEPAAGAIEKEPSPS